MSLSLELCQRLKAAGLPQGVSDYVWMSDHPEAECVSRSDACVLMGYCIDSPELIDDYNSDELIAQIHAEWPNCVGFHCFTSCWDWWAAFELEVQRKPQEIVELQEGGTPHLAEALANLYIALKEQV